MSPHRCQVLFKLPSVRLIFFGLALTLSVTFSSAQSHDKFVFIGLGPAAYKGDLHDSFNKFRSVVQAGILYNRKEKVNGELNLAFGELFASNNDLPIVEEDGELILVNSTASTPFSAFSYNIHINFFRLSGLKVYAGPGIGLMRFNPKNIEGQELIDLPETRLDDEGYVNTSFIFPIQFGVNYNLKSGYGMSFQANFMNPATDYLDNIGFAGTSEGNDQVLSYRFSILLPLKGRKNDSDGTEEEVTPDSPSPQ